MKDGDISSKDYYYALGQLLQALSIVRDMVFTFKDTKKVKVYMEAVECWMNELKSILNKAIEECDKE